MDQRDQDLPLETSPIINGEVEGFFKSSRDLGQGIPSPPFDLPLWRKLCVLVSKAAANGLLSGFRVRQGDTRVTHLQNANDNVFFLVCDMV